MLMTYVSLSEGTRIRVLAGWRNRAASFNAVAFALVEAGGLLFDCPRWREVVNQLTRQAGAVFNAPIYPGVAMTRPSVESPSY
jgi:hypothetical protein